MDDKKKLSTKIWEKQNKKQRNQESWRMEGFGSFGRISQKASEATRIRRMMQKDFN